jgi:hypothetical protein
MISAHGGIQSHTVTGCVPNPNEAHVTEEIWRVDTSRTEIKTEDEERPHVIEGKEALSHG